MVNVPATQVPRRALIAGIDTYPFGPLQVCAHDAIEVAAALSMQEYGFATTLLLDNACTRRELRRKLEALFRDTADTYLFYFSGHGWATDIGAYLVTPDSDVDDRGIDLEYLKRLVKLTPPSSTVLILLDCCHSGAASVRSIQSTGVEIRSQDVSSAIPALPQGRVVLAACRGDQYAYEDSKLGHGYFTSALLQGLLGDAADWEGRVTITALFDYVARALEAGGIQTPVFRGDIAGQLVLGTGFIPRSAPVLNEERALEVEREGEKHLQEYQSRVAPSFTDLANWKAEGYRMACQLLEPILNWFDKQAQQFPLLLRRSKFGALQQSATQRLATLGAIDVGVATSYGVFSEKLGSGSFGSVWRLDHEDKSRSLAYKAYHAQDLALPDKVRRFSRGYSAMKQMDHPHIQALSSFTDSSALSSEEFATEIAFSLVGLSDNIAPSTFLSLSKKTRVTVTVRRTRGQCGDVELDFHSQEWPVIDGVNKYEQLRKILMGRIEDVISQHPNVYKKFGSTPPFQVYLNCENVPLTLSGVAASRLLISQIVDKLEGR